ncbi:MAG: hypothetical protein E7557_04055 [Ruminococcaceae bacterium]|nr:hypothetical protein [Oscillospiraceae bacterium]
MKYCKLCGIMLEDEATICPSCKTICDSEYINANNLQGINQYYWNNQEFQGKKKKSIFSIIGTILMSAGIFAVAGVFFVIVCVFLFLFGWAAGDGQVF